MRYDSQTMKAVTLASLLVSSAAAGAAAAGGPFFFAQTCPMSIALSLGNYVPPGGVVYGITASTTVTEDFVITDLTVNEAGKYALLVDGVPVFHWESSGTSNTSTPRTSRSVSFADGAGVPVPAGSVLQVESGSTNRMVSVIGYHF